VYFSPSLAFIWPLSGLYLALLFVLLFSPGCVMTEFLGPPCWGQLLIAMIEITRLTLND
jgi:hypothetical protein